MKNHLRALIACIALLAGGGQSYANFSMSPSGTTTAFAIDAANQGTSLCAAASTECPAAVPVNTAGAPLFTTVTPGFVTQLAPNSTNLATWTSGTGTTNIDIPVSGNFPSTLITLDNTAVTGGVVTIRGLKPNGSYETIGIAQIVNKSQFFNLNNPYTLPTGGATGALAQDFLVGNQGYSAINVQLSTAITGAGTLVVSYRLLPYSPLEWALLNPLVGGTAILGKVGIDQTTPGVTNNVTVSPLPAAARHSPGCTVGVTSAQCLAAATALTFLQLQNTNTTSTNNVACNIVGGAAVLNSATSIQLAPGQSVSWGPNTGGVPSGAINCIATSASSPLYVEWN